MLVLICISSVVFAVNEVDFTTSGTFYVPQDVTEITVHVWGGGGGGGGAQGNATAGQAGGGGGGAYARKVLTVVGGQSYTVTVGSGGSGGAGSTGSNGTTGGLTSFSGHSQNVGAAGGSAGGGSSGGSDGAGGAGGVAGATGDFNYSGGSGASGNVDSGGGGGSAGQDGSGSDAVGLTGGSGGANGGATGADGLALAGAGSNGFSPGAGGSGAYGSTDPATHHDGGNGGTGLVKIVCADPLIGIVRDRHLNFGAFVVNGAGTVTITNDAAGSRTKTGDIYLVGSNSGLSAEFSVSGASKRFEVVWSVEPTHLVQGGNQIPVTFDLVGYENRDSAANTKVFIGGTLTLAGTEPSGTYSANATITVAYE